MGWVLRPGNALPCATGARIDLPSSQPARTLVSQYHWYELPARWLQPRIWALVFVGVAAIAFLGEPMLGGAVFPVLIDPTCQLLGYMPGYQILAFILLPLALLGFAIGLGALLRKTVPRVYGVTGGRGL